MGVLIQGRKPRVCIDPGHGGSDPGACNWNLRESDLNLSISTATILQLDQLGIDGYLTRDTDQFLALSQRTEMAKGADCLVSIHCNAGPANAEGIETLYGAPGGRSKALANYLQQALLRFANGHRNRGMRMSPSQDYPRNLYVLRTSPCAAALVEVEFLSNLKWAAWLADKEIQKGVAYALAQGIQSFLCSLPNATKVNLTGTENNLSQGNEPDVEPRKA